MWKWVSILFIIGVLLPPKGSSQSLTGVTGLLTIPTAEMPADKQISLGMSYWNKKYIKYRNSQYDLMALYVNLGYLPFLEISLRVSRRLDAEKYIPGKTRGQGIGERMPSIRLRLLSEHRYRPAIVAGAHDFISLGESSRREDTLTDGDVTNFNALYLVGSKHFNLGITSSSELGLHLGYGSDWMDAHFHQFVGMFGGISLTILKPFDLILEYDAEHVNVGMRLLLWRHFQVTSGWQNIDTFVGGFALRMRL
ncbi:MAG: hypothetical protein D6675_05475 [Gemmatimonadetes bacterium]|nr:MAG: hypothetical protein D6675_05475 [Gemmatimonadota bacterium]